MKINLLFFFIFHFLLFANVHAQVAFNSWNINSVNPGGSISFSPGIPKSLSIVANLQKPNNQVVGDSYVYVSVKNSGGSEIAREQVQHIPASLWSMGTGSNPVYYSFSNSANVLLSSPGTYKGYLVYVTSGNVEYFTSNYINFTVIAPISNNTISYSGTTSFVVSGDPSNIVGSTPAGGTGSYTYQWQSSTTSASAGFSNVAATTVSYNPPTISLTTHYRRVVTSGGLSSNSNVVTITITVPPILNNSISNSGNSTFYGISGDPSIFNGSTPTGGSGTYSYQWESSTTSSSSGFSNIVSATSLSYDPPTITQTTHYRRVVTSSSLSSTSNVITINLYPPIENNVICCDQTVYNPVPGNPLTGTTPSGGSSQISVCWQVSLNGIDWTNLYCGSTSNSYQLPSGQDGIKFYRRVASDNVSQNVSNQVQVTYVNTIPLGSDFGNPLPIGTYSSNDCSYTTKVVNSLDSDYENQIGDSRKDVFFYFNVVTDPTGVKFSFTTCDSDTDTKLYLFDSNQNLITSTETGSDLSLGCGQSSIKADLYSTFLPIGSYYLVVEGDGNLELDIATMLYSDCVDLYEQQYVTPQAPTNLTSDNISPTGFTLEWTALSGVTGYKIYKNDQYIETVTATTSSIQGLFPNTTYSFKVSAYNLGGESPLSAAKTVTTSPPLGSDFGNPLPIGTYSSNDCSYTTKVVNSLDGYENQIGDSRKDVFFYFNVTDHVGVRFGFRTCDSDMDTKLYLFDSNQNLITSAEDGTYLSLGCGPTSDKADFTSSYLIPGQYYLVVEGNGNLKLNIATVAYGDCVDLYEQQYINLPGGRVSGNSQAKSTNSTEFTKPEKEIALYPNPTLGKVNVSGMSEFEASVYDPVTMSWHAVTSRNGVIDLSSFKKGYYILKLKGEGIQFTRNIIKE